LSLRPEDQLVIACTHHGTACDRIRLLVLQSNLSGVVTAARSCRLETLRLINVVPTFGKCGTVWIASSTSDLRQEAARKMRVLGSGCGKIQGRLHHVI